MKNIHVHISALIIVLICSVGCNSPSNNKNQHSFKSRYLKTIIPSIELENASIEQAVKLIQHEWNKQIDDGSSFIIEIKYPIDGSGKLFTEFLSNEHNITFKAKEISVYDVLDLMSSLSQYKFKVIRVKVLEEMTVPQQKEE
jgi:hypothetical protein